MQLRKVRLSDAPAICEIYNHYIQHTAITFETVALREAEMRERIKEAMDSDSPYYVAEAEGKIAGYYYLHEWNRKSAYSTTKEVTIYLDKEATGKGLGSQLFHHLLETVDRKTTHVLLSGITLPNDPSVKLHEKFGFQQVSHLKQVGWKLNQWQDVGHWQLILNGK